MEFIVLAAGVLALAFIVGKRNDWKGATRKKTRITLNYLIPGQTDKPHPSVKCAVAGINHLAFDGQHRQDIIAKCRLGEPIILIRDPDNPADPDAVALFRKTGESIGFLTRYDAEEIAPLMDKGWPMSAEIIAIEPFDTDRGETLLGVRIKVTPYEPGAAVGR